MYCPKCGTKNDDNAYKCTKCGIVIQGDAAKKKTNTAVIVLIVAAAALVFFARDRHSRRHCHSAIC